MKKIPVVTFETTASAKTLLEIDKTKFRYLPGGGRIDPKTLPKGINGRPICRWCQVEEIPKERRGNATHCSNTCKHRVIKKV